jgi:ubiquinone/menaquinone biosynthesis C-methylase UbiE
MKPENSWFFPRLNYNRLSRVYDLLAHGSEGKLIERGLQLLAAKDGEYILEIGVGTGHGVLDLALSVGNKGRVLGMDISDRMLRISNARIKDKKICDRVQLQVGDAAALPFREGYFDSIFISFTYELFESGTRGCVLGECSRVLKPGGLICIVGLNKQEPQNLMTRLYEKAHRAFPQIIDCHPVEILAEIIEKGFVPILEENRSMVGLPVGIVLSCKDGSDLGEGMNKV